MVGTVKYAAGTVEGTSFWYGNISLFTFCGDWVADFAGLCRDLQTEVVDLL
jgi:hypothetical protein